MNCPITPAEFGIHQNVFIVFFAIFWGAIANVQPRWKAFQWPLIFTYREVFCRVLWAFVIMNIVPIIYLGVTLWDIHKHGPAKSDDVLQIVTVVVTQGVLPAFGMFALYRVWLGIVELQPKWFYKAAVKDLDVKYHHVEPTFRLSFDDRKTPVVDLGEGAGWPNLMAAAFYLILAQVVPRLFR